MPKSSSAVTPRPKQKPEKPTRPSRKKATGDLPPLYALVPRSEYALLGCEEARIARNLYKYGIAPEEYENCPKISDIISKTVGKINAVDLLRNSKDEQVLELLKVLPTMAVKDWQRLPIEVLCLIAKVEPAHILGQIIMCARDSSRAEAALILIIETPEVLRQAAHFGKTDVDAYKDREMILKATGTLPSPAGQSINLNFGQQPQQEMEEFDPEDSDLESDVFAYDTKTIDGWGDQRRRLMDSDKRK